MVSASRTSEEVIAAVREGEGRERRQPRSRDKDEIARPRLTSHSIQVLFGVLLKGVELLLETVGGGRRGEGGESTAKEARWSALSFFPPILAFTTLLRPKHTNSKCVRRRRCPERKNHSRFVLCDLSVEFRIDGSVDLTRLLHQRRSSSVEALLKSDQTQETIGEYRESMREGGGWGRAKESRSAMRFKGRKGGGQDDEDRTHPPLQKENKKQVSEIYRHRQSKKRYPPAHVDGLICWLKGWEREMWVGCLPERSDSRFGEVSSPSLLLLPYRRSSHFSIFSSFSDVS